jgi:hypothetical protein
MSADKQDFKNKELTEKIIEFFIEFIINLVMAFLKKYMRMP